MKAIRYILNGFGYSNWADFKKTFCGLYLGSSPEIKLCVVALAGAIRAAMETYVGLNLPVFIAFVFLIAAEFYTGVKVSTTVKGERFKSRKFGRMILKIGIYISILAAAHQFAANIDAPDLLGLSINPFKWLYYTLFIAIVFQLFISWLENLGALGYKETKTIAGFVLRVFNRWFEFDGSKNNNE